MKTTFILMSNSHFPSINDKQVNGFQKLRMKKH